MFQDHPLQRWKHRWYPLRCWRAQPLGERGERIAANYLRHRGYQIIEQGYATRYGEIDIVAVHQRTVVFIEVKTRRVADRRVPLEAVTLEKQRRLSRISLAYLKRYDLMECSSRFDVVGLVWPKGQWRPGITHVIDAFEPHGTSSLYY